MGVLRVDIQGHWPSRQGSSCVTHCRQHGSSAGNAAADMDGKRKERVNDVVIARDESIILGVLGTEGDQGGIDVLAGDAVLMSLLLYWLTLSPKSMHVFLLAPKPVGPDTPEGRKDSVCVEEQNLELEETKRGILTAQQLPVVNVGRSGDWREGSAAAMANFSPVFDLLGTHNLSLLA